MCKVLERVLTVWGPLQTAFEAGDENEERVFPLTNLKVYIRELYSLMRAMVVIIKLVQGGDGCTSAAGWYRLIRLRTDVISREGHLSIYYPSR